ncbi:hypothetical protein H1R20_g4532, partial [Candolleomyces eurysporus]
MVDIPPGIIYLAQRLPKLAAPPILTYLAYLLAESHLDIELPTWLLRSAVVLSLPVAFTVKVQWQILKTKWEAARHGAVLPPPLPDSLPGGLGFILAFMKGAQVEYPGELWKFHRAMTRPFFTKDRISHFDVFDRHGEDAINQMKTRFKAGIPVDFQDVIARFTLDAATEFLLGNSVRSLSEGLPYPFNYTGNKTTLSDTSELLATQFVKSFTAAQETTAFRIRFGDHWPLVSFWKDELKEHMKVVHAFIDPIVAVAIDKKKSTVVVEKDEETLLENLVNSTEDPIILRDEVMNLLVAGRDTTASLLTYTIYMLAEHPDTLSRLREEILTSIGPDRKPTYADLREMKYLRAVLNALEFDPDRFIDERLQKYLTPNPFIFLPFNAGPRICLGQQFAYHEASFFLVRLLQNFASISLAPEAQPLDSKPPAEWATSENSRIRREKVKPKAHLTMYIEGGLWVTMEEASHA